MKKFEYERFQKFLELAKETFICLRCGWCCWSYSLKLPDSSWKSDCTYCKHLVPRHKEGNKWIQAICKIHDRPEYPKICQEAVYGISYCPLGTGIWKSEKDKDPQAEFPKIVERAIEFYYKKKK